MLVFGPYDCMMFTSETFAIYNLTSYKEGFPRIDPINPLTYYNNGISASYEFDMWYANFLINNPDSYRCFLDIMRQLYNGMNVWILIDPRIEFSMVLVESLEKFILERYGYVSNIIRDPEDVFYLKEGTFDPKGFLLIDRELESYLRIFGYRSLPSDGNRDEV